MFSASSGLPNDQPMMRPVVKRPKGATSRTMDASAYGTRAFHATRKTVVPIDKNTAFNLYCVNMINANILSNPLKYLMNINTIMERTRNCIGAVEATIRNIPRYLEVNKNAVLLHDIEPRWHALEGDGAILIVPNNRLGKIVYDDIDLNLSAIHKEAQRYNDCTDSQKNLDTFLMQSLLQHILSYFKNSWSELTLLQRHTLSVIVKQNDPRFTVFDQLTWVGYDCIIRGGNDDLGKVTGSKRKQKNITSTPPNKSVEELAVDFAVNFSFAEEVIDACDQHFERSLRRRMPYTKMFSKN